MLSNHLAGYGPDGMQVGVPQLDQGLMFEPSFRNQETIDDTGPVVSTAGLLGGFDDLLGDDLAVRTRHLLFLQLARDGFLNQIAEAKSNLGDIRGRNGRLDVGVAVDGQH